MKTTFLLSDVVLMGLISSFTTLAVIVLTAIVNARIKRIEKKQDVSLKQMDGHMTKLIETTAELNEAIGLKKGKAEEKAKMIPIIEEKVEAAKNKGIIEGIEQQKTEQANGPKNSEENSNQ